MIYNDICNARQKHCINELLRIEYFVWKKRDQTGCLPKFPESVACWASTSQWPLYSTYIDTHRRAQMIGG